MQVLEKIRLSDEQVAMLETGELDRQLRAFLVNEMGRIKSGYESVKGGLGKN